MNNKLSATNLNKIRENLISYTCETLDKVTIQKLGFIRLTYGIMLQAMADLYSRDVTLAYEAGQYFKSEGYELDCKMVNIDTELMSYIVLNPDKYLESIRDYRQVTSVWGGVF